MIGRRARRENSAVLVEAAPLYAHFVSRTRISSFGVAAAQNRRQVLCWPLSLRSRWRSPQERSLA
jgi:hypothetical protein